MYMFIYNYHSLAPSRARTHCFPPLFLFFYCLYFSVFVLRLAAFCSTCAHVSYTIYIHTIHNKQLSVRARAHAVHCLVVNSDFNRTQLRPPPFHTHIQQLSALARAHALHCLSPVFFFFFLTLQRFAAQAHM
ncbi:hypothetical protein T492DRAFT_102391 [Pavlovales sp. CCMP2436]|nr:hypothetical protein T492DRAFT_102391 [Pavlovales sp. CCMP2436]